MRQRFCNYCQLGAQCKGPVWGRGEPWCGLWFVGEAPGGEEDYSGNPFSGKSGKEKDSYERKVGLQFVDKYTTNIVKCRPPKNRDPEPDEIEACRVHLEEEMAQLPLEAVIATLGRFSTEVFLGECDLEMMHGIPFRHPENPKWIIVPAYHPAVGLYDGRQMTQIREDFQAVADTYNGLITPENWVDEVERKYREISRPLAEHNSIGGIIAVDTETVDGKCWSVQVSSREGEAWFISTHDNTRGVRWLKRLLENPDNLIVMHNAQFDLRVLAQLGIHPVRWVDTMLMAHLLCNLPKALKVLAFRLAGMKMRTYQELTYSHNRELIIPYLEEVAAVEWPKPAPVMEIKGGAKRFKKPWPMHRRIKRILKDMAEGKDVDPYQRWLDQPFEERQMVEDMIGKFVPSNISTIPFQEALEYACADPDATLRVYRRMLPRVKAEGLWDSLIRDQNAVPMAIDMETVGMPVDSHDLLDLREKFISEEEDLLESIHNDAGYWINPDSYTQVGKLLYKDFKIKAPGRTSSTAKAVLETIKDQHPVIAKVLRHREVDKVRQFIDRLLYMSKEDGRVHDDFSFIRTVSGRLAASILMTIPHHSDEGQELRNCFVASPGNMFLSGDYSQIELRVLAHMSDDPKLIKIYLDDLDVHSQTASDIFGIPIDQLDKHKHRLPAKTVNFGIVYGMSAKGLLDKMVKYGWSIDECERFIDEWFALYPGAKKYLDWAWTQARRYGHVRCLLGRKRLIPEIRSVHYWIREKGLRNAGNTPIQGTAAEIMKEAMGVLVPKYREWRKVFYIWPLIQIHDDLLWEIDKDRVVWTAERVKQVMETVVKLKVPVKVDMQMGERWTGMKGVFVK